MIIDCHGHYTTEPKDLHRFRKDQTAAANAKDKAAMPPRSGLKMSDDEIRESIEANQLKFQKRARHRPHDLLAARLRHGPPHRRRERQPRMDRDLQRPDPPGRHALSEELHRRLPAAAVARRAAEERHRRARALREDGLRRLQPQSRSVRRLFQRAADDRQVVLPVLREDGRARRAGDDPRLRLLQSGAAHHRLVLSQRRHHGVHAGHPVRPVQGFPDARSSSSRTAAARCRSTGAASAASRSTTASPSLPRSWARTSSSTPASIISRASTCSPRWCRSTTSCSPRRWSAR